MAEIININELKKRTIVTLFLGAIIFSVTYFAAFGVLGRAQWITAINDSLVMFSLIILFRERKQPEHWSKGRLVAIVVIVTLLCLVAGLLLWTSLTVSLGLFNILVIGYFFLGFFKLFSSKSK